MTKPKYTPEDSQRMENVILAALQERAPLTAQKIGLLMNLTPHQVGQILMGLRAGGKIERDGWKGKSKMGWRLKEPSIKRHQKKVLCNDAEHDAWMAKWRLSRQTRLLRSSRS